MKLGCGRPRHTRGRQLKTGEMQHVLLIFSSPDFSFRIRHQQHESMEPECLMSALQGAATPVIMCSWHTLGNFFFLFLIFLSDELNVTTCQVSAAELAHLLMITVGNLQYHYVPWQRKNSLNNNSWIRQYAQWTVTGSNSIVARLGCGRTLYSQQKCAVK